MRIAVDAMGGDHAPREVVAGALLSCHEPGHEVILVGRPEAISQCLDELGGPRDRVSIAPADDVIGMGEPATAACKRRSSSLAVAIQLLRDGEAQAVVSAGNSGAFMACAFLCLGTLPGIERPAIAVPIPRPGRPGVLLDAGANADCKPTHLVQFAQMGRIYARDVLGMADPAVGLLSIGEEASKGTGLTKAAHKLLADLGDGLHFIGNVEPNRVFSPEVDVVVSDGFTGNIVLKTLEGTAAALFDAVRGALEADLRTRLGAALVSRSLRRLSATFDYATYGGALLLGVNGICVVGHGRSDARAISSAVAVACRAVTGAVTQHITETHREPVGAATSN
jgi:glycerol-3-phosphate acyltransferase PlsX